MSVDDEGLVVDTKVCLSGDFNLNLSEFLSHGSSTRVEVCVNILNIKHDKF